MTSLSEKQQTNGEIEIVGDLSVDQILENYTKRESSKSLTSGKKTKKIGKEKINMWCMLKLFFLSLYDPLCDNRLSEETVSFGKMTSVNGNQQFSFSAGPVGPICGPSGCH
jgi:hypothetical protein